MASRLSVLVICAVVVWAVLSSLASAKTRHFYIGVVEGEWDYAPWGDDLSAYPASDGHSKVKQKSKSATYLQNGPERIGRKYMKAMYREFTNDSFTQMRPHREKWMGLLGPMVAGDEGDIISIVLKNMAMTSGRNFSLHPGGLKRLFTSEDNEGSLSGDETSGEVDGVAPGHQRTYLWEVTGQVSPTPDDPDCLTWTYRSRVHPLRDLHTGLLGVLLTCKPGTVDTLHEKYAQQFAMAVNVFDENESWYIDHNIQKYLHLPSPQSAEILKDYEDFKESNMMHGFNGLTYGHLDGLEVCLGSRVLWHVVALGTGVDGIQSLSVSGHPFLVQQHRVDAIALSPMDSVTAELDPQVLGRWRVQSSVLNHAEDGMVAWLNVSDCAGHYGSGSGSQHIQGGQFRRYYLSVDEADWNYAPGGSNLFDGGGLLQPNSFSEEYFRKGPSRVGGVYRKAVFREYEDVTFSRETGRREEEQHLGFLGPVLRVETGDVVALTLKNNATSQAFSLHPHGATFVKMWEDHAADLVESGQVRTSYWYFPDAMGPGPLDPPCITRLYTSSPEHLARDAYSGLVGPILVCRKGALDSHGQQRQVDREFFLLFSVTDENLSGFSHYNLARLPENGSSQDFYRSNLMHNINGYMYGNLPGLTMCQGDRVAWHLLSLGAHVHTAYFHGQPLSYLDTRRSGIHVLPGSLRSLLMKAQNPGQWALVDQTSEHYNAGMKALFRVSQCGLRRDYSIQPTGGQNRTYFLQAEEELWDYAPSGINMVSGKNLSDPNGEAYIFTTHEGPYLGTTYRKVRYHQYTDATFTTEILRAGSKQYLGVLGPVIMAQALDAITVVFRNKASRPYSVHAQGLLYTKASEGSPYGGHGGRGVAPGDTVVYHWSVPLDFAPAEGDPACISQAYYSAVDPVKDTNSGLIGPLVICKPGSIDAVSGERQDVDSFFVLLFKIFDENQSWYLEDNIQRFGSSLSQHDAMFGQSNLMHSINGFVYANGPPMTVTQHSGVAWHLMTLGGKTDLHSVHWRGNPVRIYRTGQHTAHVVPLFPGVFHTVWMNATRLGKWRLHDHVHDHLTAGMEAVYTVTEPPPLYTTTQEIFGEVGVH
ncbi:hypothetical protein ACOMHN_023437 [Nucella lapillus]